MSFQFVVLFIESFMDDVTNVRDVVSLCVDYERYINEIISRLHISYFNVNEISYLKIYCQLYIKKRPLNCSLMA
jgi:hypothetical protein